MLNLFSHTIRELIFFTSGSFNIFFLRVFDLSQNAKHVNWDFTKLLLQNRKFYKIY